MSASKAGDVFASDEGTAYYDTGAVKQGGTADLAFVADSSLAEEHFCTRAVFISEDKAMLLLTKRWGC